MSLREHYRSATTPPDHVEVASRRERWKRDVWQVFSTVLCLVAVAFVTVGLTAYVPVEVVLAGYTLVLALLVDAYVVFPWGVRRFDLVVPWQFRVEEDPS